MENNKKKIAFVVWPRETKLSEFLSNSLEGKIIHSYIPFYRGCKIPVFFRYLLQAKDTFQKLNSYQPEVIFVQNPPIFAVLTVYIYGKIHKIPYAIDTHTAGFLDFKWKLFHFLHRFLAKRSIINTLHNYKNCEIHRRWNIFNNYILQFYNPQKEEILKKEIVLPIFIDRILKKQLGLKIFMVNRFANDDAYIEVIETARILPQAVFFITGDYKKISEKIQKSIPANVVFTGYLNHDKFIKLMDACDLVLALTKRKDTVLWSIREIMALGKPFVTSDSEVLRHYFKKVAVFSQNNSQELKKKIIKAWNLRFEIKLNIEKFVKEDRKRWGRDIAYIKDCLNITQKDSNLQKS